MCLFEEDLKGKIICGVDEVGRGPLAGPVVAAAVVLPEGFCFDGIKDSKKLNSEKIKKLAEIIKKSAVSYAISLRCNKFIDHKDILTATFKAMESAVSALTVMPDIIIVDGNQKIPYIKSIPQQNIVKGDSTIQVVSAAAIIAKDFRDRMMEKYGESFPEYGFELHKGYGTKKHLLAIEKYGICEIHRQSFLKRILIKEAQLI